jgi:hypothetical protein
MCPGNSARPGGVGHFESCSVNPGLAECALVPAFLEEAALILEAARLDTKDAIYVKASHDHAAVTRYSNGSRCTRSG